VTAICDGVGVYRVLHRELRLYARDSDRSFVALRLVVRASDVAGAVPRRRLRTTLFRRGVLVAAGALGASAGVRQWRRELGHRRLELEQAHRDLPRAQPVELPPG